MSAGMQVTDAPTVATLRAHDDVDSVFACVGKERQLTRSGSPFLTVELRDRTGAIRGRAFKDADRLAGNFERGELVRVAGRVERFREELQIEIRAIEKALDGEPRDFLPTAYRDLDELDGFLEHLAREVYDPALQQLLQTLLGDPKLREQLRLAPCSPPPAAGVPRQTGAHHAYLGGLLEHTVAVATLAIELCTLHPRLDRDLLLTAAILHDIGKTREFSYGAEVARTPQGRMLGHVELGLRMIAAAAPAGLDPERLLALEHCVLFHHGSQERAASPEAVALQRLNALDAQVKGAIEHAPR